ncbi:MAG TPA: membrane lipoprotein lipid attachment site-containing protein [Chitinophagales bacterium]|nr:membrane lipoprotein lipid attachment site-containing protein [Chitinophagales bacterium]
MKRIFIFLLMLVAVAGCKKKETVYSDDLQGTWQVYKYLFRNVDQTQQFQNQYGGYTITFTNSGTFVESYHNASDSTTLNGTYSFTGNDEMLVLEDSTYTLVDTVLVSHYTKREYTIFNLTSSHVQLRNDSTQLYMSKLQ